VVAVKESFVAELAILRDAVAELEESGMSRGAVLEVFTGPGAYLYGEETALLEAIDGRPPFPRVAPPYRYGVDEVAPEYDDAPPALVDNVETMANVPGIMTWGPRCFRELGTDESERLGTGHAATGRASRPTPAPGAG
jgi:NADH:ubiquinone oxidoreductase subunit F (NADH-binding)